MDQRPSDSNTSSITPLPALRLVVSTAPQVNFAAQQNAVPVIRDIELINDSGRDLVDLSIEMQASPEFLSRFVWRIDRLPAGGTFHAHGQETHLEAQYLLSLQESLQGHLVFKVFDNQGEVLCEQRQAIEVLARNEWGGYGSSPELLAAFCMPNEPSVERLLRNASDLLRAHNHDSVLHPYDTADPRRIWLQVSAIWNAVLGLKLDYAHPPSSFERSGQKVRTPDAIVDSRRATCVDTSLLLAALFEQVGLHSLLILDRGHAYVGVWLRPEGFPRPFTQDLLALRKRVQLRELLVMESTLLCEQGSFASALRSAEARLSQEDEVFVGVLDIARAREERIRPLSFVERAAPSTADDIDDATLPALDEVPDDPALLGQVREWQQEQAHPTGRLGQWQRRLLDLTLRNPLLNMRSTRSNIALVVPDPAQLEDMLAQGKALAIEAAPVADQRDGKIVARQTGQKLEDAVALAALARKILYVQAEPAWLEGALVDLYRKARNDLQEGGSNTLFLAIGSLRWQRSGAGERTFRAPLILVPVTITRQSVRSGIKISLSDDEPRFNTTLLEMLRQDFSLDIQGLEGALPEDENGVDIQAVLTRVRQQVRDVAGFEVRDEVVLGTFSFAKYLMWKDLVDRTESLKDNAVVRHLIDSPRDPFAEQVGFVDPRELDQLVKPEQLFTPLSADSSQLAAVMAAAEGKNFVMIGPPGTGKSQTIANMIVHNLGLGRTVLFVSEKAAALDVVYRRLREQGLGEFCLELHSNKARKLDVIKQLGQAWDARGDLSDARWQEGAGQLERVRDELNAVVAALHTPHELGLSLRQSIGIAAGNVAVPVVDLGWARDLQHAATDYNQMLYVAERVEMFAGAVGDLTDHPLALLDESDWSMVWQQSLLEAVAALAQHTQNWQASILQILGLLGLGDAPLDASQRQALGELVAGLRNAAGQDLRFAFSADPAATITAISKALTLLDTFQQDWTRLSCTYDRADLLKSDLRPAQDLARKAAESWWLARLMQRRHCRRYLQTQAGAQGNPDMDADLPVLARLQATHTELEGLKRLLGEVPGWAGLDSEPEKMRHASRLAVQLREAIASLALDMDSLMSLRTAVQKLVVHGNELLAKGRAVEVQLAEYQEHEEAFMESLAGFAELACRDRDQLLQMAGILPMLATLDARLYGAQAQLQTWCAWRKVYFDAQELGLQKVLDALEQGLFPANQFRTVVEVNYARWWAGLKLDETPVLRRFLSIEHERRIEQFAELDAQVRNLTCEYVRTHIRADLAGRDDVKRSSEFGIIRRELEKKTRHKALRQLMSEAPNAIPQLTPCLLMSPLSIAQYLPVDQPPFDLVIFDEASQITVWDAIGAIARGKQTVVVGDPKQLPPTSFFSSGQSEEDEDDEEEQDLESILDEMLGSNLPVINLSWHYRSRHESLITFSNQRYYDGGLVTFPSPVTTDTAVSMQHVQGSYERGATQTNRAEAEAIVADIEQRLMDPLRNQQTLGVVTFNQKQQTLILDLLDEARRRNPELDRFFAEDLIEPVFVKNLESVQGDERDVILFSITFGPDQSGRVSMNFGPLNKSGGERRLNVAVTRARIELKVFSTLRADQIDLSRTAAIGVRDLKHFLEFAERGIRALSEGVSDARAGFDSLLEKDLASQLQQRGWTVIPQIGVSSLRIDLGVVDPDDPEYFLAGIQCDGSNYQRAATARDRDLVRVSVLGGLGWEILRLWSIEYWLNRDGVVDRLDQQLQALHRQRRA